MRVKELSARCTLGSCPAVFEVLAEQECVDALTCPVVVRVEDGSVITIGREMTREELTALGLADRVGPGETAIIHAPGFLEGALLGNKEI